ncbi:MAG: T9SS type A sorting domain-containing protein [bacterium]
MRFYHKKVVIDHFRFLRFYPRDMKNPVMLLPVFSLLLVGASGGQIPLSPTPNWSSIDTTYSTGGAFADIDNNGYLDFCVANGNDMASNANSVYFNHDGNLETVAAWWSADRGYFGHCYAGDIDNDGDEDWAVAYLGGNQRPSELLVRIYRNTGSGLESLPCWRAKDSVSSFDCCLGDFDLDGDLDLAISAGDAYQGQLDRVRIYRNNQGIFDTLPCWYSKLDTASDAVRFADIDNDGDLDLFVGHQRKVVMYQNNNGSFDTIPHWVVRREIGWVLRLELGDYDRDHYLDLAVASNDQLQGPNSIKVFHNNQGTLDTIAAFTMQSRGTNLYSSCVAWGDVNGDGYPELAAGGWWRPVVVYLNNAGVLDTLPAWSWSPPNPYNLVCEALLWTDVRNHHLIAIAERHQSDGFRQLFTLSSRPIQFLDSIKVNDETAPISGYCYDRHLGWVSFATPPPANAEITFYYHYSTAPDLAVTNWAKNSGNHLFLNTTASAVAQKQDLLQQPRHHITVHPNPSLGAVMFSCSGANPPVIEVYAQDGRLVKKMPFPGNSHLLNLRDLANGVYFVSAPDYQPAKFLLSRE